MPSTRTSAISIAIPSTLRTLVILKLVTVSSIMFVDRCSTPTNTTSPCGDVRCGGRSIEFSHLSLSGAHVCWILSGNRTVWATVNVRQRGRRWRSPKLTLIFTRYLALVRETSKLMPVIDAVTLPLLNGVTKSV
jgi:hypothetical protein